MRTEDIEHRGVLPARRRAHRRRTAASPTPSACCSGTTRRSSRPATPRSDLWFTYHLGRLIREKLARRPPEPARDGPARPGPHLGLPGAGAAGRARRRGGARGDQRLGRRAAAAVVLHPAQGRRLHGLRLLDLLRRPRDGVNQAARRKPGARAELGGAEWGWAWPANRRILYNRASADPDGKPWSERKALVWWDAEAGKWAGHDVPDFIADRPPSYRPRRRATGVAAIAGVDPFIMQADGKAWLFAPAGLVDGPLPAHYEPQESPFAQPAVRPAAQPGPADHQAPARTRTSPAGASRLRGVPYVATTYRLTEHHTAGGMCRCAALPVGAAAGVLLRGVAGAGRRDGPGAPGLGHDRHGAARDRGPGPGHRADAVRRRCRGAWCTRSGCRITGARTGSAPATALTT